jgi:hypothetical protein
MKAEHTKKTPLETELLILPDGQVLVHNLTPQFATLLHELKSYEQQIAARVQPRLCPNDTHELPD